jgi:hypothetical protein
MLRPRALPHLAALVLILGLAVTLVGADPASAQDDDTTTTSAPIRDNDTGLNDIIPQPNSGQAPEQPSDRGGWQQYMVFGLIIGGMAVIVLLAWRGSTKARRAGT